MVPGVMFEAAKGAVWVNIIAWVFCHYFLPIWKRKIDQAAFVYDPIDPETPPVLLYCWYYSGP